MGYKSDLGKADRIDEAEGFPAVVLIDNTNFCNLRCSSCDHVNVRKHRPLQTMSMDLYKKIVDEIALKNPSARVWEIFFGDPFLCKDMPARIAYAKSKGLKDVVVNSNGVLMTREKAKSYIRAGLDAIYVGIDAAAKGTYDKIRVGGDFGKAVGNVLAYRDLLKEHGRPGQKIFVQFVVNEFNEGEIEAFKEFWTKSGVPVKIRPKISWAGLVAAPNLRPNDAVARKPCYWLMRTMNICADGRVALCAADLHCQIKNGSVRDKSLEELWLGRLKGYRNMHKEGRFDELPRLCRDCRDWQSAYAEFSL